jgi:hypothetical protein
MSIVTLRRDRDRHHNEEVSDDLDALLKELGEHAAAARRADATADRHRKAIRELLPKARKAGAGPAELERTILSIYVAGTISRWTKTPGAPPGKKKTPGRAPRDS